MHARGVLYRVAGLVAIATVLASCNWWSTTGYGPARAGYNAAESNLGVQEVGDLEERWSADLPTAGYDQPVTAEGTVYVASGRLLAYDADGDAGCAGEPTVCEPLWRSVETGLSTPAVSDGVAYAIGGGTLHAYDAAGIDGCSGTPTTCEPLWTANVGARASSPAITHGTVYVTSDRLYAFDADGVDACGGSPTLCEPLWQSSTVASGGAAVSGGRAYVVSEETDTTATMAVFDALGGDGCSGVPTTCDPLWTYAVDQFDDACFPHGCSLDGPPTVAEGTVYVLGTICCSMAQGGVSLIAFDAAGQESCTGSPRTCAPLRSAGVPTADGMPWAKPPVAVANGTVYAAANQRLSAFDSGDLARRWTAADTLSSASVADGVVHVLGASSEGGAWRLGPHAFAATGPAACADAPAACSPLWSSSGGPLVQFQALTPGGGITGPALADISGPAVAKGKVFVRSDRLRAYGRG